eukprot:186060-Chlamydomonas_euryale.AAC.3
MLELWGQLCDCICRPPRSVARHHVPCAMHAHAHAQLHPSSPSDAASPVQCSTPPRAHRLHERRPGYDVLCGRANCAGPRTGPGNRTSPASSPVLGCALFLSKARAWPTGLSPLPIPSPSALSPPRCQRGSFASSRAQGPIQRRTAHRWPARPISHRSISRKARRRHSGELHALSLIHISEPTRRS